MKNEDLHWLYNQQEQVRLEESNINGGVDLELQEIIKYQQ